MTPPHRVSVSGVTDDNYLMSSSQSGLQGLIRIAEHYGKRYKIKYGAGKTKITTVGSDIDMNYFEETAPWSMGGQTIKVVENNEHLGQIVSSSRQESKNVDLRIQKARGSLYSLLGPAFAYKCLLSPLVKLHIFRTLTCPIIRSGLSSFALRTHQITPISLFHRKVLKAILHLTKSVPTPAVHFLLGELPIEGRIHRDMFSLFYSVWCNPDAKIHQIVKYLLSTSSENSRTWVINLRHISRMYQLEDPLSCLEKFPPSKSAYKELISTKITSFHEKEMKVKAKENSLMHYMNVNLCSLRGRVHPSLANIITTKDVKMLRPHVKFLTGDYLTYQRRYQESGKGNPICKICTLENESICHILTQCPAYQSTRDKILQEFEEICSVIQSNFNFENIKTDPETLTQFLLDPTSFNLKTRVHINDPVVPDLFKLSRDYCYAIHSERTRKLEELHNI